MGNGVAQLVNVQTVAARSVNQLIQLSTQLEARAVEQERKLAAIDKQIAAFQHGPQTPDLAADLINRIKDLCASAQTRR